MARRLLPLFLSLVCATPALGQVAGYCYTDPLAQVLYFSAVFTVPELGINKSQMLLEWHGYLKARYGFTSNSNYPVSCGVSQSVAAADAARATFEGTMRHDQKQVVEAEWKYVAGPEAAGLVEASADHRFTGTARPRSEHGVCFSEGFAAPQYVSDVFDAVPPVSIAQWNMALMRFLSGKYGYKGSVECDLVTLESAHGLAKAREDGARAAGRNVIETGWKYDVAANTAPAAPVDEDREPPRVAPGAPSAASTGARNLALKESGATLAYCQKDRLLSVVFDCLRVQQTVMAYRTAHTGDATQVPLADLFTGDKLDCTKCMDNQKPKAWARRQALAQQMKMPVANCVSQHFVANLKAKPYSNRIREHYDAAVAACKG